MSKLNKKTMQFTIALAMILLACSSRNVYAQKPRVLVCGYMGKHDSERKMLEKYGYDVTVGCPGRVDPDDWDGLVVPGSKKNVHPKWYGAAKDPHTNEGDLKLDKDQIRITRQFVEAKKPILGICRGCQLVNVVMGGTLIQHIGAERGGEESGKWEGYHRGNRMITIKKGSWLYEELGKTALVRHSHHQCVDRPGQGFIVTQFDRESGLIEGMEHESLPIYCLQWHPDLMKGEIPEKVCMKFKQEIMKRKNIDALMQHRYIPLKHVPYN